MITNNGLNILRNLLNGTAPSLNYVAIGTSSAVAVVDDTGMGNEANRVSSIGFREYNTGIVNDVGVFKIRAEIPPTKRNNFQEVGIVTSSSGGTLFNRIVTSSSIAHTTGRRIRIDMEFQIRRP